MTRQEIIRMAAEAGVSPVNDQQIKFEGPMWLCLERFAALVAAAEREACAKVCFEMAQRHNDIRSAALEMASESILLRGDQT
jgi:predicted kinase